MRQYYSYYSLTREVFTKTWLSEPHYVELTKTLKSGLPLGPIIFSPRYE